MSEAKCAGVDIAEPDESLESVLVRLEEALAILDDLERSPELGAHLDLLLHRLRDEIGRQGG